MIFVSVCEDTDRGVRILVLNTGRFKIPAYAYGEDTSFAISLALTVIASLTGNLNATRKVNEQYLKL
jgi:hypothetical protein